MQLIIETYICLLSKKIMLLELGWRIFLHSALFIWEYNICSIAMQLRVPF